MPKMKPPARDRKALADHYRGLRKRLGTRAARAHWKIDRRAMSIWMRAWEKALYETPAEPPTGGLAALIQSPSRKTPPPR